MGPGAADAVDLGDVQQVRGGQNVGIERAVLTGRRNHGDFPHSGYLSGHGPHEQAGNERSVAALPAGHIQARAFHGFHLLPQHGAVGAGHEP